MHKGAEQRVWNARRHLAVMKVLSSMSIEIVLSALGGRVAALNWQFRIAYDWLGEESILELIQDAKQIEPKWNWCKQAQAPIGDCWHFSGRFTFEINQLSDRLIAINRQLYMLSAKIVICVCSPQTTPAELFSTVCSAVKRPPNGWLFWPSTGWSGGMLPVNKLCTQSDKRNCFEHPLHWFIKFKDLIRL